MSRFSLEGYEGNAFDVHQCIHDAKKSADPDTLTALSNHWDDEVMHTIASNVNTPQEVLRKLASLADSICWRVLLNPSYDFENLDFPDGIPQPIRVAMAKVKTTPREVLIGLWKNDSDRFVREEARINLGIGFVRR